jgi:SpoVK/Ycf46/Vps4 family AAA+-type ATPase
LKILENLLEARVEDSLLLKKYDFSEDEVKILKYMTQSFIKGQANSEIADVLETVLSVKEVLKKLDKLPILEQLHKKGYIEIGSTGLFVFDTNTKSGGFERQPLLEILNSTISLSQKFLFLLEGREKVVEDDNFNISNTPYSNSFEYMEDKFKKVKLYIDNRDRETIESEIKRIDREIEERVDKTKFDIPLRKILVDKKLSKQEELVFLAVLSEEYAIFSNFKNLRSIENLLELISLEGYEKFQNRSLFRESSKLVKSRLFDFETSIHFVNEQKSFTNEELFVSDEVLQEIEGESKVRKKRESKQEKLQKLVDEGEIFELIVPKYSLDDVILHKKSRDTLQTIVKQLDKKVVDRLVKWGVKDRKRGIDARIIFHGSPGTGKTMTAIALGKTLKKEILHFDCSKVLSMYVGESEKNVRNIFDSYKHIARESGVEPILFLNEADQFLTSRSTDTSSSISQMYNQMQNIFLEQIENFQGVLIATTNLLENLDKAFSRRFNYKVEFKPPTEAERVEIWKRHLPKHAPFEKGFSVEELAKYKLTGGQIDLIVKNTAFHVATEEKPLFKISDFLKEIERERKSSFEGEKVMGFIN